MVFINYRLFKKDNGISSVSKIDGNSVDENVLDLLLRINEKEW